MAKSAKPLRLEWIEAGSLTENPAPVADPEEWKPIPGYESTYEASNLGRVRRIGSGNGVRNGRVLRQGRHRAGYLTVALWRANRQKSFLVHGVIAAAFIGPRADGQEVNHKDGNKWNNRASNLEYVSRQGNIDHAVRVGLIDNKGERNSQAKLSADDVAWIRELYSRGGIGYTRLARRLKLNWGTVRNIITRRTWNHVK